jgi:hypothetical protein
VHKAADLFAARWPNSAYLDVVRKAGVVPGTRTGWGSPLAPATPLAKAFLAFIRPRTVIGRMTGFRRVPLNVKISRTLSGSGVSWVGEGKPIPLSAMALEPALRVFAALVLSPLLDGRAISALGGLEGYLIGPIHHSGRG